MTDAGVRAYMDTDVAVRAYIDEAREAELTPRAAALAAPESCGAGAPGLVYEALLSAGSRRSGGIHYTPARTAAALVEFAWPTALPCRVCDPTMGGGAFLLAAADRLLAAGLARQDAASRLWGADVDPDAVDVARCCVERWAGGPVPGLAERLVVSDVLAVGSVVWDGGQPFDLMIGNPPFLGQMNTATARRGDHSEVALRLLGRRAGYADTATLFLLKAREMVAPGGRVALVQPLSILSARDAGPVRDAVVGDLTGLWTATDAVFDAGVRVCAPVLTVPNPTAGPVATASGADVVPGPAVERPQQGQPWSSMLAAQRGTPRSTASLTRCLGEVASASAGFRDLFYALARLAVDEGAERRGDLPIITAGLIDPLALHWLHRPTRLAGSARLRPALRRADLDALPNAVERWVRDRLVPKVLVAPQTRVVEAAVDATGNTIASTPVVAIVPDGVGPWHIATALVAPTISTIAVRLAAGSGLSVDAVRLPAKTLLDLPLPANQEPWDEAAARAEAGDDLLGIAGLMLDAYGEKGADVYPWWVARLPHSVRSTGIPA